MKILAVMGSPRKKGNTFGIVEKIREHLLAYDPDTDFEYLFLRDVHLEMCTGCFACISRGEDKCPLKDDRDMVAKKMDSADGIIFAAPTYAMGVPGLMKNFIDRFAYTCHRPCFFGKTIMAVTTIGGSMGMKLALKQLAVLSGGGNLISKLGIPLPPIPMADAKKAERIIEKGSKAFLASLQKNQKKFPSTQDWGWFCSFKTMCSLQSYGKICPADIAYYKDKGEYFYPLEGHHGRRLIGKAFRGIFKLTFGLITQKE